MSREAIQHVYRLSCMSGSEKNVMFVLAIKHDESDGFAQLSCPQIAYHSCLNESTVRSCLASLEKKKLIEVKNTRSMKGHKYALSGLHVDRDDEALKEALFEEFWKTYPKKRNKQQAKRSYYALKPRPELAALILKDIAIRIAQEWDMADANLTYIPHPSTYINNRCWEEELTVNPTPKNGGAIW